VKEKIEEFKKNRIVESNTSSGGEVESIDSSGGEVDAIDSSAGDVEASKSSGGDVEASKSTGTRIVSRKNRKPRKRRVPVSDDSDSVSKKKKIN
jgi:hypothetical protein